MGSGDSIVVALERGWQSPCRYRFDCHIFHRTDLFQEQKAESFVDALKDHVAITASLLHGGQYVELAVRRIMPGGVIGLRAGDLVFQRHVQRREPCGWRGRHAGSSWLWRG